MFATVRTSVPEDCLINAGQALSTPPNVVLLDNPVLATSAPGANECAARSLSQADEEVLQAQVIDRMLVETPVTPRY